MKCTSKIFIDGFALTRRSMKAHDLFLINRTILPINENDARTLAVANNNDVYSTILTIT